MVATRRTRTNATASPQQNAPLKRKRVSKSPANHFANIRKNLKSRKLPKSRITRAELILDMIDKVPCIRGWDVKKILGVGTVGTVFLSCEKKNSSRCAAMKVQVLANKKNTDSFHEELAKQAKFAPYAPRVYEKCIATDEKGHVFGIIIMEPLGLELDGYLSVKRTQDELDMIGGSIERILRFCHEKKITHGDLALFNIAFNSDNKLVFLDFDRASSRGYHPDVDFWRLFIELFESTRSNGTKPIVESNMKHLMRFLPLWANALGVSYVLVSPEQGEQIWIAAYEKFCRAENVKCLD